MGMKKRLRSKLTELFEVAKSTLMMDRQNHRKQDGQSETSSGTQQEQISFDSDTNIPPNLSMSKRMYEYMQSLLPSKLALGTQG